jgi:hypothetical protein
MHYNFVAIGSLWLLSPGKSKQYANNSLYIGDYYKIVASEGFFNKNVKLYAFGL